MRTLFPDEPPLDARFINISPSLYIGILSATVFAVGNGIRFKSRTRKSVFHFALTILGNACVNLPRHPLCIDKRTDWVLLPWYDNQSRKRKTLNSTSCTPLKNCPCVTSCSLGRYKHIHTCTHIYVCVYIYIYIYMFVCVYIRMLLHMCVYIYIYI